MFDDGKTKMIGLPYGKKNCDDMLSRFYLIPERHRRTNGQNCYINIARRQCAIKSGDASIEMSCSVVHHSCEYFGGCLYDCPAEYETLSLLFE